MRSESAPTVGWMIAPSMLRVLESRPVRRSPAPAAFSSWGSTKLLNAKNAPAPTDPAQYRRVLVRVSEPGIGRKLGDTYIGSIRTLVLA